MSWLDAWRHRLHVLRRRERYAEEQGREVRFHLELEKLAESQNQTMDAELAARRRFGNVTYYREEMRYMSVLRWIDRTRRNFAYALRGLHRAPVLATTVIATVALGVGVNAAIVSLLDRLLLRQPPMVERPEELRRLYIDPGYTVTARGSHVFGHFNYVNYRAVRDATPGGAALAYTPADSIGLGDREEIEARASYVSANYFSVLGVRPLIGRAFGAEEDAVDAPTPVMVISERLWESSFGRSPILGTQLRMANRKYTVIGVVPRDFIGLDLGATDVWVPLNALEDVAGRNELTSRNAGNYFAAVARIPAPSVRAEVMTRGAAGLRQLITAPNGRPDSAAVLLDGPVIAARGPAEQPGEVSVVTRMTIVSVIVLLIACANIATLLLVRARQRGREMAVRRALGVSRAGLYEQLLTESLALAALGGVAAIVLALVGGRLLRALLFPAVYWIGSPVDWRVAWIAAAVVSAIGIAGGLAPAALSSRGDVMQALRAGAVDGKTRRSWISATLLAVQASLSLVLLVGAGLVLQSLSNIESIDVGLDVRRTIFANPPGSGAQPWGPEGVSGLSDVADAMRRVPGVRSAALSTSPPLAGFGFSSLFRANGDSLMGGFETSPTFTAVTPDYFSTVGVGLIVGRLFDSGDRAESEPVVIVNRTMARLDWPNQATVGQCVRFEPTGRCARIVGVVEDTHRMLIIEGARPQFYRPLAQFEARRAPSIIVRADANRIGAVRTELAQTLRRHLPAMQHVRVRAVADIVEPQLRPWRLTAELFTIFAALSLVVAAIGIFSVVSYCVTQRVHEIGVRIALGARVRDILDLIVAENMGAIGVGVVIGIGVALGLGRVVSAMLFGVTATDVSSFIGAVSALGGVAIIASVIPAAKGARVDPITALRGD